MDLHGKVRYGMGDESNKLVFGFSTVGDGIRGVHIIHKAIESGKNKKEWVAMGYDLSGSIAKNP